MNVPKVKARCAMDILPTGDLSRQALPDIPPQWPFASASGDARIAAHECAADDRRTSTNSVSPSASTLPGWKAPPFPPHVGARRAATAGSSRCDAARHARGSLGRAARRSRTAQRWTYSFHGPYADFATYENWVREAQASRDPQFYAIVDAADGRACGSCAYMRIEPKHGVIEIGNIYFAPRLAHTRAATEAMYLLMANAFALGYRRYEWKCDSCNLPSRAAATRFGFTYEGTVPPGHRQQGPQSRHHLVRHHRRRLARRPAGRLSTLARPGQLRRRRAAEAAAVGAHRAVRGSAIRARPGRRCRRPPGLRPGRLRPAWPPARAPSRAGACPARAGRPPSRRAPAAPRARRPPRNCRAAAALTRVV